MIYGSQALMAAIAGFILTRVHDGQQSLRRIALLVFGAWVGELIALTAGGNLLANELDP